MNGFKNKINKIANKSPILLILASSSAMSATLDDYIIKVDKRPQYDDESVVTEGGIAIGPKATDGADRAIAIGSRALAKGHESIAIGAAAPGEAHPTLAEGAQSIAIGANVIAKGNSSISIGNDDTNLVNGTVYSGDKKFIEYNSNGEKSGEWLLQGKTLDEIYSRMVGKSLNADGEFISTEAGDGSVSIGVKSTAREALSAALGTGAQAKEFGSLALGTGAYSDKLNAIALGAASKTDKIGKANAKSTILGKEYNWAGGATIDEGDLVSIGSKGYERQLINVAPGEVSETSTDAINGSQLYSVLDRLEYVGNNTIKLLGNTGETDKQDFKKMGLEFKVNGENGLVTTAEGSTVTVKIDDNTKNKIDNAANSSLSNITDAGKNTIKNLIKIESGDDNTVVTSDLDSTTGTQTYKISVKIPKDPSTPANNSPWKIVANEGIASSVEPDGTVKYIDGKNINITQIGTNFTVSTNDDVTFTKVEATTIKAGDTIINSNGITLSNGPSVTQNGIDAGDHIVGNVKDGEKDKDAVNVGQLKQAINNITSNNAQINQRINQIADNADAGTAAAMAIAGVPQAYLPGKRMVAGAASTYHGKTGYAIGLSAISDNGKWIVKSAASGTTNGTFGTTVGAGYMW